MGLANAQDSFSRLKESVSDYASLKKDAVKLRLVEDLSVFFNKLVGVLVLGGVLLIAAAFLGFGLCHLLGAWMPLWASALVMAALFLAVAGLLYRRRDGLLLNTFVTLFSQLFFREREDQAS